MKAPDTPELDRLLAVAEDSHKIGDFLDWLEQEREVYLSVIEHGELTPCYTTKEALLAAYYKINLSKVELEQRAVLEHVRSLDDPS